jgi:hypothetical protein
LQAFKERVIMSEVEADRSRAMALERRPLLALNIALALGAVVGAAALDSRAAATAAPRPPAPWCANLGGRDGGWDCSYHTFEQCMATARGLSSNCQPNPWALAAPNPAPPRRARR